MDVICFSVAIKGEEQILLCFGLAAFHFIIFNRCSLIDQRPGKPPPNQLILSCPMVYPSPIAAARLIHSLNDLPQLNIHSLHPQVNIHTLTTYNIHSLISP